MRVAWIVSGGFPAEAARRRIPALARLAEELAERCELHLFSLGDAGPGPYPLGRAWGHPLGGGRAGLLSLSARLLPALRAAGPWSVLHGWIGNPPGVLAAAAGRALGAPAVVTLTGGELTALPELGYGAWRSWRSRLQVRSALGGAARVVVLSRYALGRAQALGYAAEVIPLGIEVPAAAAPRPPEGPPWRLLQIAALARVKDPLTSVRALARLAGAGLEAELTFLGDDALGGSVQRQAEALGVRVRCLGWVSREALAAELARAHLHLLSSVDESQSVAVLEAAAAGVATVGTAVGLIPELAPAAAAQVPVGDDAALASEIARLLRAPEERARMAAAARAWAQAHDVAATAAAYQRLYEGLTEPPRDESLGS